MPEGLIKRSTRNVSSRRALSLTRWNVFVPLKFLFGMHLVLPVNFVSMCIHRVRNADINATQVSQCVWMD